MSAPLVERLATSCVALRENTVYTADGQAIRLGVQADEMEEAAIRIADLEFAVKAAMAFYDNLGRDHEPGEVKVLDDLAAAIAKAEGRS